MAGEPETVEGWMHLGNEVRERGDLRRAIMCYVKAVEMEPDNVEIHNILALAFLEDGAIDQAAKAFNNVLKLDPENVMALTNLGVVLHRMGRLEEAIEAFAKALKSEPGHAEALNNLAVIIADKGDVDKAIDMLKLFEEPGDHGGEMETSLMQVFSPDLVLPMSEAGDGAEKPFRVAGLRDGLAWAQRIWPLMTADTGVGNPALATPEKGRLCLEALTARIGDFFIDLAAADPADMYE